MNRFPLSGYIGKTHSHLEAIIRFLKQESADVIGLIEIGAGSYRSDRKNQAELIAESLGHYHAYQSKYPAQNRLLQGLPVINKRIVSGSGSFTQRWASGLTNLPELETLAEPILHTPDIVINEFRIPPSQLLRSLALNRRF